MPTGNGPSTSRNASGVTTVLWAPIAIIPPPVAAMEGGHALGSGEGEAAGAWAKAGAAATIRARTLAAPAAWDGGQVPFRKPAGVYLKAASRSWRAKLPMTSRR